MLLAVCSSLAVGWTALGPPPCAFRRTAAPIAAAEWEDCAGCKLLRPPGEPRALVHFLGGVFVSPAPHVAYRYLLEQLADRGYLVVATPYAVDFDYTKPAADVKRKLDAARAALAAESSAELPLVSLGHSLGALMQTLLACTYADYADACAGSVLVSWNNKPVSDVRKLPERTHSCERRLADACAVRAGDPALRAALRARARPAQRPARAGARRGVSAQSGPCLTRHSSDTHSQGHAIPDIVAGKVR